MIQHTTIEKIYFLCNFMLCQTGTSMIIAQHGLNYCHCEYLRVSH